MVARRVYPASCPDAAGEAAVDARRRADVAQDGADPLVERFFVEEIHRTTESKLEALVSALWRLQVSVLDLFSTGVRAIIQASD